MAYNMDFEIEPTVDRLLSDATKAYKRPVWVEIDLAAVRHNVGVIRRAIGGKTLIMAVVKANGYGHGAIEVARAALEAGAEWLGVALPEEGVALRKAGITLPALILAEPPASAASLVVDYDLSVTVCSKDVASALDEAAASLGKTARIHLKVDTGMNRIGVAHDRAGKLIGHILTLPNVRLEGVFTHFAKADDPSSDLTDLQMDRFEKVVAALPEGVRPIIHAANSAGLFLHPRTRLDMVRAGISLYGLHPSPATKGLIDLRPALSLKARPSLIKMVGTDEGISYGHTHIIDEPTTVATVPIGYGDGYTRRLSNIARVLIGGERRPIVGTICMDQFMVDLGKTEHFEEDEIVLIGHQGEERIAADEIADLLGTINYEVVCMINNRVPRVYLNE